MKGILKKYSVFSLLVLAEDDSEESKLWLNEQLSYILQSPTNLVVNSYGLKSLSPKVIESFAYFEYELISKNKSLRYPIQS
jgi:hypothetical protein